MILFLLSLRLYFLMDVKPSVAILTIGITKVKIKMLKRKNIFCLNTGKTNDNGVKLKMTPNMAVGIKRGLRMIEIKFARLRGIL